ncbi:mannosyltransferase [Pleosporales sp. CAS-2024a]
MAALPTCLAAPTRLDASHSGTTQNTRRDSVYSGRTQSTRQDSVYAGRTQSTRHDSVFSGRTHNEDRGALYSGTRQSTKYFHEPAGPGLGHYDRRFFRGKASDQERMDTQAHMIRAYLTFFNDNKLDTWIAHGTLLGWWWNGKRLPWDVDLDTQVLDRTLERLGAEFNQTLYQYEYESSGGSLKRTYLLDVNPWITERVRGDGMNVIDARWIDVRNGLYIDITGLSETRRESHPGTYSCKNYHNYAIEDLYPMRETVFEGVFAKVPYAYDKILTEEYTEKALVKTDFNGHVWDPKQREWVKSAARLRQEEEAQRKADEARQRHEEMMKLRNEEARKQMEQYAQKQMEEELQRQQEEAQRMADEAKKQAEEAQREGDESKSQGEEAQNKAAEQRKLE